MRHRISWIATRRTPGLTLVAILSMALGIGVNTGAIGLAAAAASTRVLQTFLFGVEPLDPLTFAIVAAGLATVAILTSPLAARRATKNAPAVALRTT